MLKLKLALMILAFTELNILKVLGKKHKTFPMSYIIGQQSSIIPKEVNE